MNTKDVISGIADFRRAVAEVVGDFEGEWERNHRWHSGGWQYGRPFAEIREKWLAETWRILTIEAKHAIARELRAGNLHLTNN